MPRIWYDIAAVLPADGQLVYVRRLMYENPYEATWHDVDDGFTMPNGLILPWQWVSRWSPL